MGVVACCGARTTGPKISSWKQGFCGGVVSVVGVDFEGTKKEGPRAVNAGPVAHKGKAPE